MPDPADDQPVPTPGESPQEPADTSEEQATPSPPSPPEDTAPSATDGSDKEANDASARRREIHERPQTRRITRNSETRILRRPDLPDLQSLADLSNLARESQLGLSAVPAPDAPPEATSVSETDTPPAGTPVVRPSTTAAPDPPPDPRMRSTADTRTDIRYNPAVAPDKPAADPAPSSVLPQPPAEEWGDTGAAAFERSRLGDTDLAPVVPRDAEPDRPVGPHPGDSASASASASTSSDDFLQRLDKEIAQARQQAAGSTSSAGSKPAPSIAGTQSLLTPPRLAVRYPSPDTIAGLLLRPLTRFFRRPRPAPAAAIPRQLVLSVQEVTLADQGRPVLDGVSFDVIPGEAVGIIGRNGSGKTALLKICAGIIRPDTGLVLIDGIDPFHGKYRDRQQARRKIGYVFQDGTLISNIPVYDNIAMPLRYHTPLDEESIARKVGIWLRRLGLTDVVAARPGDLPTHRARLVNLARALVADPHILILDEPFAMLDPVATRALTDVIRELKDAGTTVIIASTGGQRILDVADRFGALEDGQLARIDKSEIRRRGVEPVTAYINTQSGRQVQVKLDPEAVVRSRPDADPDSDPNA